MEEEMATSELDKARIKLIDVRAKREEAMATREDWRWAKERQDVADDLADDIENRTYNFYGPVGMESAAMCAKIVTAWARQKPDPITIRLCSPGGDVRSGMMIYDLLSHIGDEMPVKTIAIGSADSMAALILQAGTERLIGRKSSITLHELQITQGMEALFQQSIDDRRKQDEYLDRINDRLIGVLLSRVNGKITEEQLRARIRGRDWRLDPDEAIQFGFVDRIGWK